MWKGNPVYKKSLLTSWLHQPPPRQTCTHWPSASAEGIQPHTGRTESSAEDRGKHLLKQNGEPELCNQENKLHVRGSRTISAVLKHGVVDKQIQHVEEGQSNTCITVKPEALHMHVCSITHQHMLDHRPNSTIQSNSGEKCPITPEQNNVNLRLESGGSWEEKIDRINLLIKRGRRKAEKSSKKNRQQWRQKSEGVEITWLKMQRKRWCSVIR